MPEQLSLVASYEDPLAASFCERFFSPEGQKYVFGINEYTRSIMRHVRLDGVIDEYSGEVEFNGVPVVPLWSVPVDALVVSVVVVGKPFVAEKKIARLGCEYLDYYSLFKHAKVELEPVIFQKGMPEDIKENRPHYNWLFNQLADQESKRQLVNILNFRISADLRYMRGFSPREDQQYFEDFLHPWESGEVFVDIGAFDGQTTLEFVRRVPDYAGVHVFEPITANMEVVRKRLVGLERMHFHEIAAGSSAGVASFSVGGSCSKQDDAGTEQVTVAALDAVVDGRVSFIKMDIEGGESAALEGATATILREHPRLAIAAYHGVSDLWRLARQVLSIRSDYRVYLRHYTEGIAETDLFFVPDRKPV